MMSKGGRQPVGGWIKFEKKLREDIRVKRMARALPRLLPGLCNGSALPSETLGITIILGALAQLWMHADTFAREDDTLDLTTEEVDGLVGIVGFSTILPSDWCELIDQGGVKLPNYQLHNGPEAKEKAQTALRVAKFRAHHGNGCALQPEEDCNGDPLPDQTRLNKTKLEERVSVPRETNPTREEVADRIVRGVLMRAQAAYPKGIYKQADWILVEREIRALLEEGQEPAAMLAGVERYAAQVRARGCEGTEFVTAPLRFFKERQFFEEFPLPAAEKRGKGPTREEQEQEDMRKLRERRASMPSLRDFRDPNAGETAEQYRRAQDDEFKRRQPRDVHGVIEQLAKRVSA